VIICVTLVDLIQSEIVIKLMAYLLTLTVKQYVLKLMSTG